MALGVRSDGSLGTWLIWTHSHQKFHRARRAQALKTNCKHPSRRSPYIRARLVEKLAQILPLPADLLVAGHLFAAKDYPGGWKVTATVVGPTAAVVTGLPEVGGFYLQDLQVLSKSPGRNADAERNSAEPTDVTRCREQV